MCIRPSVRPSLCRSVEKVSGSFWNYWLNSLDSIHTLHLSFMGRVSRPYSFSCSYPQFLPCDGHIFARKWGFVAGRNNYWLTSVDTLAFILMGWVSWPLFIFVFLPSIAALWWSNICRKMWFPGIFCSITLQWAKWCRKFAESKVFQKYPTTTAK